MYNNIPNAELSPRIVNGVIRWYYLDTFSVQLSLDLTDQDGEPLVLSNDDTVSIVFRDQSRNTVKEFTFAEIADNTVTMEFDSDCTALFDRGNYTYIVAVTHGDRTTIAHENKAVVE